MVRDGFEVSTGAVRQHAVSLAGIRGDVASCASAADTTVDPMAFGLVNAPLAAMASSLAGAVQSAIADTAEDLQETVEVLRAQARQYDSDDASARSRVRGAGR